MRLIKKIKLPPSGFGTFDIAVSEKGQWVGTPRLDENTGALVLWRILDTSTPTVRRRVRVSTPATEIPEGAEFVGLLVVDVGQTLIMPNAEATTIEIVVLDLGIVPDILP